MDAAVEPTGMYSRRPRESQSRSLPRTITTKNPSGCNHIQLTLGYHGKRVEKHFGKLHLNVPRGTLGDILEIYFSFCSILDKHEITHELLEKLYEL